MRTRVLLSAALFFGGLIACGGGGGGGGSTGPSSNPNSLAISPGTEMLRIRATETFAATLTYSNGTTQAVTPTWGSSSPTVATIDANGRATAVASGTTSLTAQHSGLTASRGLRVVPDYQGTWNGRTIVRACRHSGGFEATDFCGILGTGDVDYFRLVLTQQSADVSGTLDLGGFIGTISGTIAINGTLTITGSYTTTVDGVPFQIAVTEWQSDCTDNARMTGRMVITFSSPALAGSARVDIDLLNTAKEGATLRRQTGGTAGALRRAARAALRR